MTTFPEEIQLTEKAFDEMLLRSIDDALASLGESARQAVYFHLENEFKVQKSEIPRRLDHFGKGLEKIFGPGARFIEILIMKKLHEKVGKPLKLSEGKELVFVEYVAAAKRSYLEKEAD